MTSLPAADDVRRYIDLGFRNVGDEPTTTLVRLLIARAFEPFAFASVATLSDDDLKNARAAGLRAADLADELGRPDLTSAAIDAVTSGSIVLGRYGGDVPMVERRKSIVDRISDPVEVGDVFAVSAWSAAMIGRYREAIADAADGARRSRDAGALGVALHCVSWRAFAEFALGRWEVVTDELFPQARQDLGDRADDPPYFVQHLFGSCMLIHQIRGDEARAAPVRLVLEHLAERIRGHHSVGAVGVWLAFGHMRAGDVVRAMERIGHPDEVASLAQRPFADQVRSLLLAQAGRWDEADEFVETGRRYAADAGLRALPVHLDRLAGRAALARGRVEEGIATLAGAASAFAELGCLWDASVTQLLIGETQSAAGRPLDARDRLVQAAEVFERIGARDELGRARAVMASTGG